MSDSSEEESESRPSLHRVAKKSTTAPVPQTRHYSMRKTAHSVHQKTLTIANRFLDNFNPETSVREKRKLRQKINPPSSVRRPPGAVFDENGVHIATCTDLCDCLVEDCCGCFFPCPKCGSQKCGMDCRVHRKFIYDQIEYHGYDIVVRNPLTK